MSVIGYIRVSTDQQDADKQKHLLLQHARANQLLIDEFGRAEVSSRKSTKERGIDELMARLGEGDVLLVAELSRLAVTCCRRRTSSTNGASQGEAHGR